MVPAEVAVEEAHDMVRRNASTASASICLLRENPHEGRPAIDYMKQNGYRYLRSEPLMVRRTGDIDSSLGDFDIRCVSTLDEGRQVDKLAGGRQFLPEDLDQFPPPVRVYYAVVDGVVAGYARSVSTSMGPSYLAGMYTDPERRRCGIASNILRKLLTDEARYGIESNVLVATRDGEKLYRSLDYETLGSLYIFKPIRK
jgi:GNAT superfamily N-acetyltransferase